LGALFTSYDITDILIKTKISLFQGTNNQGYRYFDPQIKITYKPYETILVYLPQNSHQIKIPFDVKSTYSGTVSYTQNVWNWVSIPITTQVSFNNLFNNVHQGLMIKNKISLLQAEPQFPQGALAKFLNGYIVFPLQNMMIDYTIQF
jgi:hypothetical protein